MLVSCGEYLHFHNWREFSTKLDFQPEKRNMGKVDFPNSGFLPCPSLQTTKRIAAFGCLNSKLESPKRKMERLPADIWLKIFCLLDHQNLATALQVCRKWKLLASDNMVWSKLFSERWGIDQAAFYAPNPIESRSWKDVYETQDRCDRVGLGLKIIREGGDDYFLVHQGQIQRYLGSRRKKKGVKDLASSSKPVEECLKMEEPCRGILDKILFFLGDLEAASADAKRSKVL